MLRKRLFEQPGHGPSRVDVEPATAAQRRKLVARARHVTPGQPVEHGFVPAGRLCEHLSCLGDVRRDHALRLHHGLRHARGTGCQHVEGVCVGVEAGDRLLDGRCHDRGQHVGVGDGGARKGRGIRRHHDRVAEIDRLERALEEAGLLGEHDGRLDQVHHVPQPAEIAGHQRIVGADRTDGHARCHAAEFHDRMRDRIAREDQQRAASRHALIEQPLRDRIRRVLELAERVLDPRAALACAFGDAGSVRDHALPTPTVAPAGWGRMARVQ